VAAAEECCLTRVVVAEVVVGVYCWPVVVGGCC